MVCQPNAALVGAELADEVLKQDGFSAAGPADDSDDLASADGEVDPLEYIISAKRLVQILNANLWREQLRRR